MGFRLNSHHKIKCLTTCSLLKKKKKILYKKSIKKSLHFRIYSTMIFGLLRSKYTIINNIFSLKNFQFRRFLYLRRIGYRVSFKDSDTDPLYLTSTSFGKGIEKK